MTATIIGVTTIIGETMIVVILETAIMETPITGSQSTSIEILGEDGKATATMSDTGKDVGGKNRINRQFGEHRHGRCSPSLSRSHHIWCWPGIRDPKRGEVSH